MFRCLAWMGVYSYTIYLAHAVLFGIPGVETLRQAALQCHEELLGRGESDPEYRGMATTLTLYLGVFPRSLSSSASILSIWRM